MANVELLFGFEYGNAMFEVGGVASGGAAAVVDVLFVDKQVVSQHERVGDAGEQTFTTPALG